MPSTSRHTRSSGSHHRHSSKTHRGTSEQSQCPELINGLITIISRELDADNSAMWPQEYYDYVACPFSRYDRNRYIHLKDSACTGYGFKDIADLRDHIKRAHSNKYGCDKCMERYCCRDNSLDECKAKHKLQCKSNKKKSESSRHKPDWMTRDQDKRYFALDFRKKHGLPTLRQYGLIWEALWPESDETPLDIWSRDEDTVSRRHLFKVLERPTVVAEITSLLGSYGTSSPVYTNYQPNNPTYAPAYASPYSPAASTPGFEDYEMTDSVQYATAVSTQDQLRSLHTIPKPSRYSVRRTQDSGYESQGRTPSGDDFTAMLYECSSPDYRSPMSPGSDYDMGISSPSFGMPMDDMQEDLMRLSTLGFGDNNDDCFSPVPA